MRHGAIKATCQNLQDLTKHRIVLCGDDRWVVIFLPTYSSFYGRFAWAFLCPRGGEYNH